MQVNNRRINQRSTIKPLSVYITGPDTEYLRSLTELLSNNGHRVKVFPDAASLFLSHKNNTEDKISAIVIEAIFDGKEIISPLKNEIDQVGDIPVIITSNRDDLESRLYAQRIGAKHYLYKPKDINKLIDLLVKFDEYGRVKPYHVLLVDDDEGILALYKEIITLAGMTVDTVSNPLKTLEMVRDCSPDVIVLDFHMPEASGTEIATLLRDAGAKQPILFVSAETNLEFKLKSLELGGDDFLVKPVDPEYLVTAVRARAERSRHNLSISSSLNRNLYEREREHLALNQHAIVSVTNRAGKITYVNDLFCDISGYSYEELYGKTHRVVKSGHHTDEFYKDLWSTISSGKTWRGEICNRRKNGDLYWVESTISPFIGSDGKPYQYVSIRTDITNLKIKEKALRDSQERLNFLISSNTVTIYTCNAKPPFTVAWISPNVTEMLGHSSDDFINNPDYWADHIHPEDKQAVFDNLSRIFEKGFQQLDYRFRSKQGDYHWMHDAVKLIYDDQGNPSEIIGTWTDISERVEATQQLQIHKERLRRGQIFANIGTWDWDIQNGELFWSERIAHLFGYKEGELETSYDNFLAAVHPDDRQSVMDAVTACVESDAPYDIEHRVVWPDGSVIWLHERGAVVRDQDGTPLQMLGIVRNINKRKMAESALRENQDKLSNLYELSPLGIALTDMEGKYIEFNKSFLEITGYSADEIKNLDYGTLTPKKYEQKELKQLESLKSSGRYGPYEKEYRKKNGELVPIRLNGIVINDSHGVPHIWSIVEDITDSIKATEDLNRFKTTLDLTLDCVFMFHPGELKFFYANQGAIDQIGYSREELMNMTPYQIKPDYDEDGFRKLIEPLESGERESVTFTSKHQHKSGKIIPVEISLQYISPPDEAARFVAIVRNITERIAMQSQLEKQRKLLDMLHKSTTTFVETSDFSEAMNDMLNTLLELTDSEYGFTGEILYDENNDPYLKTHAITNIAWNKETQDLYDDFAKKGFEFRNLNTLFGHVLKSKETIVSNDPGHDSRANGLPDGHPALNAFLGVPIFYGSEMVGMYGIANRAQGYDQDIQDFLRPLNITYGVMIHSKRITELEMENQVELIDAKESAEDANKAKSEFLSSMSHELRTPMNAILGFGQLLDYDEQLSSENRESVDEILSAGNHLLNLINEVLDLAKVESGKVELSMEPVDIYDVVNECISLVNTLATNNNITLNYSCPESVSVVTDYTRLKQILLNLLSNAIKYNIQDGTVLLNVEMDQDRLKIRVKDTGIGISEHRIDELFEPFNRLDAENSSIEGTGIGLSITRRIIEIMGGEIKIKSIIGEGSTFMVNLPIVEPEHKTAEDTNDEPSSENHSSFASKTILYIEDNPANIKLIKQIIEKRGSIKLLTARTSHTGLRIAYASNPDLILLDINMPDMSGYEVIKTLKSNNQLSTTPVLAVTANAMKSDIDRGIKAGFNDYITKPINIPLFLSTIDKYLNLY